MATTALLGLWAETSIHAGAGSSVAGIDLPIQREKHNGWPCVFGSAIKGALRAKADEEWSNKNDVRYVFGPEATSTTIGAQPSDHAGALMVSDARLLLLPVRSLTGYFKWVTCPALLNRLKADAERMKVKIDYADVKDIAKEEAVQHTSQQQKPLFLEEYRFTTKNESLEKIAIALQNISGITKDNLQKQLVIVNNDMFSYLCQYATPVNPHIAIESDKKVTRKGALWYEETLPPETVFYIAIKANEVREDAKKALTGQIITDCKAETVLKSLTDNLVKNTPYLQIGGNETVGMGWCKVTITKGA